MLPWKIIGWGVIALAALAIVLTAAAGLALYSTGKDAVSAVERIGQAPRGQAPARVSLPRVPAHVGAPYGCQPADMAYPPCNSLAP